MSTGASDFAAWWARRDDPTLLHDERVLLYSIGLQVAELAQRTQADIDPETAARAAARITKLSVVDCFGDTFSSLEPLPRLLDAPLQAIELSTPTLRDLSGIEKFPTLTSLIAPRASLTSLAPLAGLGALETLDISGNHIDSLLPLAGAVHLKRLNCAGNRIATLEPLRELAALESLTICGVVPEINIDGTVARPFALLDNPLDDAGVLARHPLLGNILTRVDRLDMRCYDRASGKLVMRGEAARSGRSNRFVVTSPSAAPLGVTICSMVLMRRADVDRLVVGVYLPAEEYFPMYPNGPLAAAVFDSAERGIASHPAEPPLIDDATAEAMANAIGASRSVDLLLDCRRKVPFA